MAANNDELVQAIAAIQKKWGTNAIGVASTARGTPTLPTGYAELDSLIGGGLPRGRVTECIGNPTSGMTTIALHWLAQAQHAGCVAVYLDLVGAFDPSYAASCGVSVHDLLLLRPQFETGLEMLFDVVGTGIPAGIVWNAMPLITNSQQQKLSAVIDRLYPALSRSGSSLLLLLPDGKYAAVSHLTSLRLRFALATWLQDRGQMSGFQASVTVQKHKGGKEGERVVLRIVTAPQEETS